MDAPSDRPRPPSATSFGTGAVFGAGVAVLISTAGIAVADDRAAAERAPIVIAAGIAAAMALIWFVAARRPAGAARRRDRRPDRASEEPSARPQARLPHPPEVNPPASRAVGGLSAVMLIDVDQYDEVFHQRGTEAADELIADIAAVVADSVRLGDKVYRYREKAFCVLLPDATASVGQHIANRVRREVHQFASPIGGEISVSIDIAGTVDGQLGQTLVGIDDALDATAAASSSGDSPTTFVAY